MERIEIGTRDERRHHADMPMPAGERVVDRDVDFQIEPPTPGFQLAPEKDVVGAARASNTETGAKNRTKP